MADQDPALAELAEPEGLELAWTDETGRVAVDSDVDARALVLAPDERALLDAVRSNFATAGATWEAQAAGDTIIRLGRLRARLIATTAERGQADAPAEHVDTLDALRATIREDLLRWGDIIAADNYAADELVAFESLVNAYRALGGDLELISRPDELTAAARRLAVVTHDLAAEDFPERIRHVVPAINDVVNEALR